MKRLQRIHLSSFDCSSQGEGDHNSNSANHVELRVQNYGDKKLPTKKPCNTLQHRYIRHICRFNLGNTKLGAPTERTLSASCRRFSSPATSVQGAKCHEKKQNKSKKWYAMTWQNRFLDSWECMKLAKFQLLPSCPIGACKTTNQTRSPSLSLDTIYPLVSN